MARIKSLLKGGEKIVRLQSFMAGQLWAKILDLDGGAQVLQDYGIECQRKAYASEDDEANDELILAAYTALDLLHTIEPPRLVARYHLALASHHRGELALDYPLLPPDRRPNIAASYFKKAAGLLQDLVDAAGGHAPSDPCGGSLRAEAGYALAGLYDGGRGVAQNPALADSLRLAAAEGGNLHAQLAMVVTIRPTHFLADMVQASRWLDRAEADHGQRDAALLTQLRQMKECMIDGMADHYSAGAPPRHTKVRPAQRKPN